jgi:uncharacterized membrane protein YhaH (DUF805 family)
MAHALQGVEAPRPTLREEANAARICRSRFIGHAVGIVLIVLAVEIALTFAGFKETRQMGDQSISVPHHWLALAGSIVVLLTLMDLAIRRRHDRGRSGIDAFVALLLLEAAFLATVMGPLPSQVPPIAVGAVAGLAGLYLLVVLVILPGNRDVNRYGASPKPD